MSLEERIADLERQLATLRAWAANAWMLLRSFKLQAEIVEAGLPEGLIEDVSPEKVQGVLDLGNMTPEEYLESLHRPGDEEVPDD